MEDRGFLGYSLSGYLLFKLFVTEVEGRAESVKSKRGTSICHSVLDA